MQAKFGLNSDAKTGTQGVQILGQNQPIKMPYTIVCAALRTSPQDVSLLSDCQSVTRSSPTSNLLHTHGMQGAEEIHPSADFPFDHVEATLKSLSFKKVPDPEVNVMFEVGDTEPSEDKYLLEFVEDGIRIYKEESTDVSFTEQTHPLSSYTKTLKSKQNITIFIH